MEWSPIPGFSSWPERDKKRGRVVGWGYSAKLGRVASGGAEAHLRWRMSYAVCVADDGVVWVLRESQSESVAHSSPVWKLGPGDGLRSIGFPLTLITPSSLVTRPGRPSFIPHLAWPLKWNAMLSWRANSSGLRYPVRVNSRRAVHSARAAPKFHHAFLVKLCQCSFCSPCYFCFGL